MNMLKGCLLKESIESSLGWGQSTTEAVSWNCDCKTYQTFSKKILATKQYDLLNFPTGHVQFSFFSVHFTE